LGGGVAGMSAAQELGERGFDIEIAEINGIPGGKARSMPVPNTAVGGRKPLPGEHGFRFFPSFYKHVTDSMSRIPFGNQPQGVLDNLVDATRVSVQRFDQAPIILLARFPKTLLDLQVIYQDLSDNFNLGIPKKDIEFFAERVWQILTSSQARRLQEYEGQTWFDFVGAGTRNANYKKYLAEGLTRSLVAAKAQEASARTIGNIFIQLLLGMMEPGVASDRLLNRPTNEAWISPWMDLLDSYGVKYHKKKTVHFIGIDQGKINGVTLIQEPLFSMDMALAQDLDNGQLSSLILSNFQQNQIPLGSGYSVKVQLNSKKWLIKADPASQAYAVSRGSTHLQVSKAEVMEGDYYLSALPVEIISEFLTPEILAVDPSLGNIQTLSSSISWMNGIQFYLARDIEIVHGHSIYVDSPWALTSVSQKQFWNDIDLADYGDGSVKGILSVDISDWTQPGLNGKTAKDCNPQEVMEEVWAQIKKSVNVDGAVIFEDADRLHWFLDPSIILFPNPHPDINLEPLLINKVNTWALRPEVYTKIPNFFIASDFVRTNTDLATMEGANEAARRAVNAILSDSGSAAPNCKIWPLSEPWVFFWFRFWDRIRLYFGKPWKNEGVWIFKILQWIWRLFF